MRPGAEQLFGSSTGFRSTRRGRARGRESEEPVGPFGAAEPVRFGSRTTIRAQRPSTTATAIRSRCESAGRHDSRARRWGRNRTSSPTGQTFNDTGSFELAPGKPATLPVLLRRRHDRGVEQLRQPERAERRGQLRLPAPSIRALPSREPATAPDSMSRTSAPAPSMHSTEASTPSPFRTRCAGRPYPATRHSIFNASASACMSLMRCGTMTATMTSPAPGTATSTSSRWKAISYHV